MALGWLALPVCLPVPACLCLSARSLALSLSPSHPHVMTATSMCVVQACNVMQFRGTRHVPCRRRLALAGTLQTQANRPPSQPATRLTWRQEGCVSNPRSPSAAVLIVNGYLPSRCSPSPCPASPRLVFPLAPWYGALVIYVLLRRPLSAGPHLTRPPRRASPKRGPAGPTPAKSTATPES